MRKEVVGIVLIVVFVLVFGVGEYFFKEDVELSPCIHICTPQDLDNVRNDLGGCYVQICDIDLAGWDWDSIGDLDNKFTGSYDGNGFVIRNWEFNNPNRNWYALFDQNSGTLNKIKLSNISIYSKGDTAGITRINWGTISDSTVQGDIIVMFDGAGMVFINAGNITNSSFSGSVICYGDSCGGLVTANEGEIIDSYSNAIINCTGPIAGGLVAQNGEAGRTGVIQQSFSEGEIFATYRAGGLVGVNSRGLIIDSYSKSNVHVTVMEGGGLVGVANPNNTGYTEEIINSYAVGSVVGPYTGGLIGNNGDPSIVLNSYWDIETTGQTQSAGGEGRETEQMTSVPRPENTYVGWDFENVWCQEDGQYPVFECDEIFLCEPQHQCRSDGCGQDPVPEGDAWCGQEYGSEYQCCVRTMPLTCSELGGVCMTLEECNVILFSGDECTDEGYPGHLCCEEKDGGRVLREAPQKEPVSEQRIGVSVEKEKMQLSPEGGGFWGWLKGLFGF
ncbi:MAG: hypothetical protein ABIH92_04155 [Nanoarchaeota archaeon]